MQASLASALGCAPGDAPSASPAPHPAPHLVVPVCWEVVRALCSAVAGCGKKRPAVIAALVNTALLPQLFDLPVSTGWQAPCVAYSLCVLP